MLLLFSTIFLACASLSYSLSYGAKQQFHNAMMNFNKSYKKFDKDLIRTSSSYESSIFMSTLEGPPTQQQIAKDKDPFLPNWLKQKPLITNACFSMCGYILADLIVQLLFKKVILLIDAI